MLTEAEKREMRQMISTNQHEVYILSLEEMDHVFAAGKSKPWIREKWQEYKTKVEFSTNYYSSGKDVLLLNKLLADMGYSGARAYVKTYGGKPHIILKGHPGLRKILTATKYGVQNAKVVKMGLGKHGGISAAKGGGILTIVLVTVYRVVDYFVRDDATLSQLFGALATDIVKIGIATGASIAAATGVSMLGAAMTSGVATGALAGMVVAIGPLVAVIAVGLFVSVMLTNLDERYGLTDKVIAALDELSEKGISGVLEEKKQAVINRSRQFGNDVAESVIDYAVDKVEQIIGRATHNLFRKLTMPSI
ncbi:MAG: hypothetical protein CVV05_02275 [Gammaproteobacteria bacterium HGW-Gammaproteobacteria-1]|jgi:hypothetical protein|nr:MAG: hypothetical protein CVV05_02275 [Gammaproteobacteria bacterium HGW-Gammaproteobacteria-1]